MEDHERFLEEVINLARIEKSIEISAPAEKIWSLVTWDRVPEWYESIKKIEWISEPKMEVGATVHIFNEMAGQKGEFDTIITEWIENQRVVWRTTSGSVSGVFLATMVPTKNGFKLTTSFDYKLPYSVLGKLIDKLQVQKGMEKEAMSALTKIKKIAEA